MLSTLWKLAVGFRVRAQSLQRVHPAPSRSPRATSWIGRKPSAFHTAVVDGNDVEAVWKATGEGGRNVRAAGDGPCFIQAETYRIKGHMEFEKEAAGGRRLS